MSTLKKKVLTSTGLKNIGTISSTSAMTGAFTGNPEEIHAIKQGQPVDAEKMLKILQDIVSNDLSLDAQQNTFFPLLSEGVLPVRSAKNFKLITNDIVTILTKEVTPTNPTTSIKIQATDCRIKVRDTILPFTADQDFVTVAPGLGQIQITPVVALNNYRTVLLQVKLDGSYNLKYLGSESLTKTEHSSRLDEDIDGYAIYSFVIQNIAGITKIVSIKRIFDYSGFNNFFLRDIVPWHRSRLYDNVFHLYIDDARHLRDENFDFLTKDAATSFDNSGNEVDPTDAVYYNNDASTGQAKFKFNTNVFPELLEPDHNIYSYPGDVINGSGIYHYIVPGDVAPSAMPFPEYASPSTGLRSIGWLFFNKIANAGAFQNSAKLKSLTIALHKSPSAAFDDNIKVALVSLPRFTQDSISLSQFNILSTTTPSPGIVEIVCNDAGINFASVSGWSSDYPAFVNTQLNVGDIVFFTTGANAGYSSKITQIVNGTTIQFEALSNAVAPTDDFIIFKNVPIQSPYIAGEVEYDVTYLNAQRTIALGPGTNLVSTTPGHDNYFKITKDGLAINIDKNKYYFIIPKVAVATDDIVSNVPLMLVNDNATNVGGGSFRNIYFYATYFPAVGTYPNSDFTLYDYFGDIGSSNASRGTAWAGFLDKWDISARDLNDTEIDLLALASWAGITQNQCLVDLTRGVAIFHPDYSPMSLYAKYRIESIIGAESSSKEIKNEGTNSSLEDWMTDKYPDAVNSGLGYVKKKLKSVDTRKVVIPAGYIAYGFEGLQIDDPIDLEQEAELILLQRRQPQFLFWVLSGLAIGWNEDVIVGAGSQQYPQFRTYSKDNEIIKLTYIYNGDNTVSSIFFEYSINNGVTYSPLITKNFAYITGFLSATTWT